MSVIDQASPNFGPRKAVDGHVGVRHVVLHYTGMTSCAAALDRLCDPKAEVSAHYLIDEDGTTITTLVLVGYNEAVGREFPSYAITADLPTPQSIR